MRRTRTPRTGRARDLNTIEGPHWELQYQYDCDKKGIPRIVCQYSGKRSHKTADPGPVRYVSVMKNKKTDEVLHVSTNTGALHLMGWPVFAGGGGNPAQKLLDVDDDSWKSETYGPDDDIHHSFAARAGRWHLRVWLQSGQWRFSVTYSSSKHGYGFIGSRGEVPVTAEEPFAKAKELAKIEAIEILKLWETGQPNGIREDDIGDCDGWGLERQHRIAKETQDARNQMLQDRYYRNMVGLRLKFGQRTLDRLLTMYPRFRIKPPGPSTKGIAKAVALERGANNRMLGWQRQRKIEANRHEKRREREERERWAAKINPIADYVGRDLLTDFRVNANSNYWKVIAKEKIKERQQRRNPMPWNRYMMREDKLANIEEHRANWIKDNGHRVILAQQLDPVLQEIDPDGKLIAHQEVLDQGDHLHYLGPVGGVPVDDVGVFRTREAALVFQATGDRRLIAAEPGDRIRHAQGLSDDRTYEAAEVEALRLNGDRHELDVRSKVTGQPITLRERDDDQRKQTWRKTLKAMGVAPRPTLAEMDPTGSEVRVVRDAKDGSYLHFFRGEALETV